MRPLRIRDGFREGRRVLSAAWSLLRGAALSTLALGFFLAFLPLMVKAILAIRAHEELLSLWSGWAASLGRDSLAGRNFLSLISLTLSRTGISTLPITLVDLLRSLVFSPLLLSSLALLYNGYVLSGRRAWLSAVTTAAKNVKGLIFVALACMLAEWFVQMVPSLFNGILSLLAEMLSWIPVLGSIAGVLAVVLSLLISLLTDFAVVVIFCYVWICAACERVTGFGALVRSWQLTRNAMRQTIFSLLLLTLLRWLAVLILALLWLFAGQALSIPLTAFLLAYYAVAALHTVAMGAVTSALYQMRPLHGGPVPGQFRQGGPDLQNMKRANL